MMINRKFGLEGRVGCRCKAMNEALCLACFAPNFRLENCQVKSLSLHAFEFDFLVGKANNTPGYRMVAGMTSSLLACKMVIFRTCRLGVIFSLSILYFIHIGSHVTGCSSLGSVLSQKPSLCSQTVSGLKCSARRQM